MVTFLFVVFDVNVFDRERHVGGGGSVGKCLVVGI